MTNILYFTIAETIEKFRTKELSPVEVINAYCARAHELQPSLNAFVHLDCESALARARKAETSIVRGDRLSRLEGIPLTVKSSIDVAGWPCPAGSLLRENYVPSKNAVLVTRLENSGESSSVTPTLPNI